MHDRETQFAGIESLVADQRMRWETGELRTVEAYLAEQPSLANDRAALCALICNEYALRRQRGEHATAVEYCRRFPECREEICRALAGDLATLSLPARESRQFSDTASVPADNHPSNTLDYRANGTIEPVESNQPRANTSRYRVLRPHAKGGLGEVFLAFDEELQREVALKEIQARHADQDQCRGRFLFEAEVTGRLEHPGIVPVYGLGKHADGRPYYAMRFIRGESLRSAIDNYRKLSHDPGAKAHNVVFRKLLGRFVEVCNAIEYAHSRGVIHRDIKPSNIMLGNYGETLVVDWGLAKAIAVGELPSQSRGCEGVIDSSLDASAETQMGAAMGTPQYMSPEQASGQIDRLGPATDIYSLGATLYCLLTGSPPVDGKDFGTILDDVRNGRFRKPRQIDRAAPRGLEAICLKAMALDPKDRYPSARALADDVEHWLADEPVQALPEGLGARLARVVRRHRSATVVTVAALGALCLLATVALILVDRERQNAEAQKAIAEKLADDNSLIAQRESSARATAEEQLRRAEVAVYASQLTHAKHEIESLNLAYARQTLLACPAKFRNVEWRALWALCWKDMPAYSQPGNALQNQWFGRHFSAANVRYSAEGSKLMISLASGVEVLDLTNRTWRPKFVTQAARVAFSNDGSQGAYALGNKVHVVQISSKESPAVLSVEPLGVRDIVWLANNAAIAVALGKPTEPWGSVIKIVDVPAMTVRHELPIDQMGFMAGDGGRLLAVSRGTSNQVEIFDLDRLDRPKTLALGQAASRLAMSRNGKHLLAAQGAGSVWDLETGARRCDLLLPHPAVISCAISDDGRLAAVSCRTGAVQMYEAATGKPVRTLLRDAGEHGRVDFSPDGNELALVSDTAYPIQVFSTVTQTLPGTFRAAQYGRIAVDGRDRIVVKRPVNRLQMTDDGGRSLFSRIFEPKRTASHFYKTIAFNRDASLIAFGAGPLLDDDQNPGTIVVISADDGAEIKRLKDHTNEVTAVAFSPTADLMASASTDKSVRLWDTQTWQSTILQSTKGSLTLRLAFSPDGQYLAVANADEPAIWNVATRTKVSSWKPKSGCWHVQFSPDSRYLVRSDGNSLEYCEVDGGKVVATLTGHTNRVKDAVFTADGKRLLSCAADQQALIWDLTTFQPLLSVPGLSGEVNEVRFGANDEWFVALDQNVTMFRAPVAWEQSVRNVGTQ